MNELWFGQARTAAEQLHARQLHAHIYAELGYIDESPPTGVIDDVWTAHAQTYVAVDPSGEIVGSSRLISWSDQQLPTVINYDLDLPAVGLAASAAEGRLTEVSALVVDKDNVPEPLAVSAGLYRAMWQDEVRHRSSDAWVFAVEPWLFKVFRETLGFPIRQLAESRFYMGAECLPVTLELAPALPYMWQTRPDVVEWFVEGLPPELQQRPDEAIENAS